MDYQNLQIYHFNHDSVRLEGDGLVVYLDPYNLRENQLKSADFIFITHKHFDHLSLNDIKKILADKTVIIAPSECQSQLKGLRAKEIIYVAPNQELTFSGLKVRIIPAYNINKFRSPNVAYHPQEEGEVGYVIYFGQIAVYHAGDTDNIPEMNQLKDIDIALLPVSGTYVMTWQEAVGAVKTIKPKIVIPIHYGNVVGSQSDAESFQQAVIKEPELKNCRVEII